MTRGITREQVFEAAEAVQAEAGEVKTRAVRDWLGTGSMSTITTLLREWRAQRVSPVVAHGPVPEPLVSRMTSVITDIWSAGMVVGETQVHAMRLNLEAVQQQAEAQRDEALLLADELQEEATCLEQQLAESTEKMQQLREEMAVVRGDAERMHEREQVTATRAGELERHVAGLTAELERLHATVEAERGQREREREAAAQQHSADLARQGKAAEQRLKEVRRDAEERVSEF